MCVYELTQEISDELRMCEGEEEGTDMIRGDKQDNNLHTRGGDGKTHSHQHKLTLRRAQESR